MQQADNMFSGVHRVLLLKKMSKNLSHMRLVINKKEAMKRRTPKGITTDERRKDEEQTKTRKETM